MKNQSNDIFIQARRGSVAAIIQILNEQLAALDVRIRAIFSDGVLQVLCEASKAKQLEKSNIVEEVKQTLEEISPRNIEQVKINSRIVQEQKLLWLEDITKDPENQLLWSQQITLTKPNILKQIANNFQTNKPKPTKIPLSKTVYSTGMPKPNQFQPDVIGIFFISLLMLTLGIQVNRWFNLSGIDQITASENTISQSPSPTNKKSSEDTEAKSKAAFTQAVRLAQKAVADGKVAQSQEEWVAIAKTWQKAAELMASVSPIYSRYDVAVNRAELYQKNSEIAKKEAEKILGRE
ncbi:MAG: hypothetical protein F6K22_03220 [Okeania sp. SIO2F4]|uniref:hypothetical protein n=1 Tax=Okeania sp. SIO2F4 TaxID=2607790 RepID=UPI001428E63C|nr:hypothetical protein [Okeania sp. SIO2F4]NES01924.1 hypothetical protein [Okeania sp. SIO2F4]